MPADLPVRRGPPRGRSRLSALFLVTFALVATPFVAPSTAVAAGEIVVSAETRADVMPPQGDPSDADQAAAINFAESGYAATASPPNDTNPVSDEGSSSTKYIYLAVIVVALGLFGFLLGPRVIAVRDRREMTWLDAWAKSAVIVVLLIAGVVYLPAKALELGAVQDMSRAAQDLIALGLWSGALAIGLLALWYAHRERRI